MYNEVKDQREALTMHIGLKIKELRKSKLWTQLQLSEISKVSERTIRRLESTGKAESATLLSIIEVLGVTMEELQKAINSEDTNTEESVKPGDLHFLQRIENGRELVRYISNAHQLGYDYHDCNTEEQIEIAQVFLTNVADVMDIWGMVEMDSKFNLENSLTKMIQELEEKDLWVFGDKQVNKEDGWKTAYVEVYSKHNPLIRKIKLDKDLMQKN
jgi:transcriptional regulator with XRE-family HTH domain